MLPDEDFPIPSNTGGGDDFPEIPTNDKGQMTVVPDSVFPDIQTNDRGEESIPPEFSTGDVFPDIDINDKGMESEE